MARYETVRLLVIFAGLVCGPLLLFWSIPALAQQAQAGGATSPVTLVLAVVSIVAALIVGGSGIGAAVWGFGGMRTEIRVLGARFDSAFEAFSKEIKGVHKRMETMEERMGKRTRAPDV